MKIALNFTLKILYFLFILFHYGRDTINYNCLITKRLKLFITTIAKNYKDDIKSPT